MLDTASVVNLWRWAISLIAASPSAVNRGIRRSAFHVNRSLDCTKLSRGIRTHRLAGCGKNPSAASNPPVRTRSGYRGFFGNLLRDFPARRSSCAGTVAAISKGAHILSAARPRFSGAVG
jgi:hypothetical protein